LLAELGSTPLPPGNRLTFIDVGNVRLDNFLFACANRFVAINKAENAMNKFFFMIYILNNIL
jgi:hypothetical protein